MIKESHRYHLLNYLLLGISLMSSPLYGREYDSEEREEIAQGEEPRGEESRPLRMGNWDFRENWQYHRQDFFNGKTQPETYRKYHHYGTGGIGYDADPEYLDYLKDRRERLRDRYSHREHVAEREPNNRR